MTRESQGGFPQPTRRDVLAGGLGALGGLVLSKIFSPGSLPMAAGIETPRVDLTEKLRAILSLPLNTDDRLLAEIEYIGHIQNEPDQLTSVDQGLWVLSRREPRAALLVKRYQLRENGHPSLTPLSIEQKAWAKEYGIHPEVLGICVDAYPKARKAVEMLQGFLQPELDASIPPDELMINPGGMAMLACTETGFRLDPSSGEDVWRAFVSIGQRPAIEEINPDVFPTGISALQTLCQHLREDTTFPFDPNHIPGSIRGNPEVNLSGGAIGLQFMPAKALELYEILDSVGLKFNPFDPVSSLIGGWVYLAGQQTFGDGSIRYGYRRGNERAIKFALAKWNPYQPQIETILNAAYSYYDKFLAQS